MGNQRQTTTREIPTMAFKRCPTPIFRHGGQEITKWTWSSLCQWHSTNFLLGRSSASVSPFFTLIEEFAFFLASWLLNTDRYFLSSEFSKHVGCHVMLTLPQGVNYGKFTGMRLTNILKYALTDSQPKLLE